MAAQWQNQPPYSLQEAQKRGEPVYEVLITDWGLDVEDTFPPSTGIDPFTGLPAEQESLPLSLAGVAIGPRSTIDRCWLTWNFQVQFTENALVATAGKGPITTRVKSVSLDAPYLASIAAEPGGMRVHDTIDPGIITEQLRTMYENGSLYVWPWACQLHGINNHLNDENDFYLPQYTSTSLSDQTASSNKYFKLVSGVYDGVTQAELPPPDLGSRDDSAQSNGNWIGPLLHLYVYLKAPFNIPFPKRLPLKGAYQWTSTALTAGVEVCMAAFCISGRKHVDLSVWAGQAGNFRVCVLRVPSGNSFTRYEEQIDSATGVVANTPVSLSPCARDHLNADYMMVYYTPTGNGGEIQLNYLLSASD